MTLGRKAFRSVRKNLSFYVVTCFLTLVAVTMLIGALTTAETIGDNCEEIYGNLNVEDAQFVTEGIITEEDLLRGPAVPGPDLPGRGDGAAETEAFDYEDEDGWEMSYEDYF